MESKALSNVDRLRGLIRTLKSDELLPTAPEAAPLIYLTVDEFNDALLSLRRQKLLFDPRLLVSPQETRRRISRGVSVAKGDKWSDLEVYARFLYMSPWEAHFASLFEGRGDFDKENLRYWFSAKRREARQKQERGEWKEGELRALTQEEETDIKRHNNKHTLPQQVDRRVRPLVNAFRATQIQNLPMPSGRFEWRDIGNSLELQREQFIQDGPTIFDTHISRLPSSQVANLKMVLVDWMESVDFHEIGSRRFTNRKYIALMLCRQNLYLQKANIDLATTVNRELLQVSGASLPAGLFARIVKIGNATNRVLPDTEDNYTLEIDPRESKPRYHDYFKFGIYYLTYSSRHPQIILAADNPENQIQQIIGNRQTIQALRGWRVTFGRLMDQVIPK